jgi:hypothetical protein
LRSANDLAALWSTASKAERAVALLSPIFDDFTDGLAEGFATRDLEVAARRLASLGRPLPHFGAAVLFD